MPRTMFGLPFRNWQPLLSFEEKRLFQQYAADFVVLAGRRPNAAVAFDSASHLDDVRRAVFRPEGSPGQADRKFSPAGEESAADDVVVGAV